MSISETGSKAKPAIVGRPALLVLGLPVGPAQDALLTVNAGMAELVDMARSSAVPIIRANDRSILVGASARTGSESGKEPVHGADGPDYVISKWRHSAFQSTDLNILLRGLHVQTLILAGCKTDIDVHHSFVDGHQNDYYMRVALDAVWGSSEAEHAYALTAMEYLQTGAIRTNEALRRDFASTLEQRS